MKVKGNTGTKLFATAAIAIATAVIAAPSAFAAPATVPSTWESGMNFTSWTSGGYGTDSARQGLSDLAALGTDRIVLTPTWYMDDAQSNTVARDSAKTPTDDSLRSIMSDASSLGMQIILKPHVDVRDGTFRGEIAPADRGAWFASYDAMINHYAEMAADAKAETLVVGTELTSMATDTESFDALIAQVRSEFTGTLTYAANWVDGANQVGFWDKLDTIGIDAYMPLNAGTASPTVEALAAAWQPYVQSISDLHARTGKPVMFTELGYQSLTGALDNPAAATGSPDPQLQAVAYAAALSVWRDVPWFQGISWWNWEAEPTGDDPAGSFSIAGKPAADILRTAQGGTGVAPSVEKAGATVPTGAGVLILTLLVGLGGLLFVRRGKPNAPKPVNAPAARMPKSLTFAPAAARPALNFVETTPAPALRPAAFAPATQLAGGTLPPQLAAACRMPVSTTTLPSTYHGAAA